MQSWPQAPNRSNSGPRRLSLAHAAAGHDALPRVAAIRQRAGGSQDCKAPDPSNRSVSDAVRAVMVLLWQQNVHVGALRWAHTFGPLLAAEWRRQSPRVRRCWFVDIAHAVTEGCEARGQNLQASKALFNGCGLARRNTQ